MPLMIIYILGLLSLRVFDGTYVYDISSLYFSKEVKKIVVFVPHQDDDLFVAGPLIYNLRNKGIETKVVFFTDGNAHDNIGHIRQKEAIKAQAKLGVPKKDALKTVRKINKDRKEYYKYYTETELNDMNNYDICFPLKYIYFHYNF